MLRIAHRVVGKNSAALDGNLREFPWTLLGSKTVGPLVAARAIVNAPGLTVFAALAEFCARSADALLGRVRAIGGLRVVGDLLARIGISDGSAGLPARLTPIAVRIEAFPQGRRKVCPLS